ncbi:hypothetical protein SFC79_04340 [Nocardioides sp. S-58]|uniref:Uncharacterized protein n=1 Tax=Nocardioides renjunii TaxID=3095075 RepID=A0ABU5K920_9ACTN|nr:hypothetical protein [Nocardioides sp. S-58]MDZ5660984.1 hypothetical protein [Nocardioides sp. S-58]
MATVTPDPSIEDPPSGASTAAPTNRTSDRDRPSVRGRLTFGDGGVGPLFWTLVIVVGTTVLGNAVLWVGLANGWIDKYVFWPPIFAIVVSVVALVTFGGFYIASHRARVAIASSVITTFMVMLVFSLTISGLNSNAEASLAKELIQDFRTIVLTVVGFYFGTESIVTVSKIFATSRSDPALRPDIAEVDEDLPRAT